MDAALIIKNAFPQESSGWGVPDEFISSNPNLMEMPTEPNYMQFVPAYIDWCIRNKDNYDQLVTDYTLNALAEYGRCKDVGNKYLNFRYLCNDEQKKAVKYFYTWCLDNLTIVDEQQIQRSMKNWD
jgi:hypothetical protein